MEPILKNHFSLLIAYSPEISSSHLDFVAVPPERDCNPSGTHGEVLKVACGVRGRKDHQGMECGHSQASGQSLHCACQCLEPVNVSDPEQKHG